MIARGVLEVVDDETKLQVIRASLHSGENRDRLERMGQYGLTSVPHDGAEALVVFPAADPSHGIVIACEDRRYRLTGLAKGEVALYTDEGDSIQLRRNKEIEIRTGTFTVTAGSSTLVLNSSGFAVTAPVVNLNSS
jgi:phage baseplate assembly protein V